MPERNVFVNLNVSNDSNFEADSGYVFQKLLWRKLTELDEKTRVFFLGHKTTTELWNDRVTMIPFHDRFDKYSTRFHFDWHGLKDVLRKLPQMNLVVNNQPEHTLAMKMLFSSEYDHEVPVVSYYHYLPFHYDSSALAFDESQNLHGFAAAHIMRRNIEAMGVSDLNLIGSNFGREICRRGFEDCRRKELRQPFEILSPPIENELFQAGKTTRDGIARVLYNQRLYKHYGTEQVIDLLDELSREERFELVVSDPTAKRSAERNRLDPHVNGIRERLTRFPFIRMTQSETRRAYHELLSSVDFAVAPIKPSALWSMAVTDVLASGKPVLCPNMAAFPEMVPSSPDLLFNDRREFRAKFRAVLRGESGVDIDPAKLRSNVEAYGEEKTAQRMLQLLESL